MIFTIVWNCLLYRRFQCIVPCDFICSLCGSSFTFKFQGWMAMLPVAFGVWCCFPKKFLIQPVAPLIEGVDGTVAHPMGCPTVPRGSVRQCRKKKLSNGCEVCRTLSYYCRQRGVPIYLRIISMSSRRGSECSKGFLFWKRCFTVSLSLLNVFSFGVWVLVGLLLP